MKYSRDRKMHTHVCCFSVPNGQVMEAVQAPIGSRADGEHVHVETSIELSG